MYVDSVVKKVSNSNIGSYMKCFCMSIILYADDILLVAPSVTSLLTGQSTPPTRLYPSLSLTLGHIIP